MSADLAGILRAHAPLMAMLALCRDLLPARAYIGAGAIRNAVWDHLHGHAPGAADDVDVVFFDASMAPGADADCARRLQAACPQVRWDVTNQAHVHLWYRDCFGKEVAPFDSLEHAVATWPDTATAIAVRLDDDGGFEIVAPFGLDDLFGLALRWNPARVDAAAFRARIDAKGWLRRWPRLRVVG